MSRERSASGVPPASGGRHFLSLPWMWTLAVGILLSAVVAGTGAWLSRQEKRIAEKPPGNRVDDLFREAVRHIDRLEALWEKALHDEARRLLDNGFRVAEGENTVVGIIQKSYVNASFSDASRYHYRADGRPIEWKPVIEHFSKKETGEWVLTDARMRGLSGWVDEPGKPVAWGLASGQSAVVFLIDPRDAADVAAADLLDHLKGAGEEPGNVTWTGPDGSVFFNEGTAPAAEQPDDILRHVSRFGDWTLRRSYPVRIEASYRIPVLAGAFVVAGLILAGGIAIAIWQRKAIRVAEERVSFVNHVSHELRTPLTNLLLNTDLALDALPVEDGKLRRRLGLIREETSRLSRIVDNVLAFARIERGRESQPCSPGDAGLVVGELQETFTPLFERKSIVCTYDGSPVERLWVDRDAFSQILSNLLSNVEKYAGEGARARVTLSMEGSSVVTEVEDDGPGIPGDARQRVFLPFERACSHVNEGASGTGLGLAISRELAGRAGGTLDLVPTLGGAKFRLVLPSVERRQG